MFVIPIFNSKNPVLGSIEFEVEKIRIRLNQLIKCNRINHYAVQCITLLNYERTAKSPSDEISQAVIFRDHWKRLLDEKIIDNACLG